MFCNCTTTYYHYHYLYVPPQLYTCPQVHNRLEYLKQLISSLSASRGIERTLLVFSHDFWDESVNELVASVDFAMTLQIFYPYSIQTHPDAFPGESPEDCPRDAKKEQ